MGNARSKHSNAGGGPSRPGEGGSTVGALGLSHFYFEEDLEEKEEHSPRLLTPSRLPFSASGEESMLGQKLRPGIYCWDGTLKRSTKAAHPLSEEQGEEEEEKEIDTELREEAGKEGRMVQPHRCLELLGVEAASASAGSRHTCVLAEDGTVLCSGSNADYQIGHEDRSFYSEMPAPLSFSPSSLLCVSVSCGDSFTALVTSTGALYTFGANEAGQCAQSVRNWSLQGSTPTRPRKVEGPLKDVFLVSVACGSHHLLALDRMGGVWTCGGGESGQLGIVLEGGRKNLSTPTLIPTLQGRAVTQVVASGAQSAALTASGQAFIWGAQISPSSSPAPSCLCRTCRLRASSSASLSSSVLTAKGQEEKARASTAVVQVRKFTVPQPVPPRLTQEQRIVSLSLSRSFCLALTQPGLAYCLTFIDAVGQPSYLDFFRDYIPLTDGGGREEEGKKAGHPHVRPEKGREGKGKGKKGTLGIDGPKWGLSSAIVCTQGMPLTEETAEEQESSTFAPLRAVLQTSSTQDCAFLLALDRDGHPTQQTACYMVTGRTRQRKHCAYDSITLMGLPHSSELSIAVASQVDYFWLFDQLEETEVYEVQQLLACSNSKTAYFRVGRSKDTFQIVRRADGLYRLYRIDWEDFNRLLEAEDFDRIEQIISSPKSSLRTAFLSPGDCLSTTGCLSFVTDVGSLRPNSPRGGLDLECVLRFYAYLVDVAPFQLQRRVFRLFCELLERLPLIPLDTADGPRMWLLLLCCPLYSVMLKSSKEKVRAAEAIDRLILSWSQAPEALRLLLKHWIALQEPEAPKFLMRLFKAMVATINGYLDFLISTKSALTPNALQKPVEMLKDLYEANSAAKLIPYPYFYNDSVNAFLLKHTLLANDYMRWLTPTSSSSSSPASPSAALSPSPSRQFSFCQYPFMLNTYTKSLLIKLNSMREMRQSVQNTLIESLVLGTHVNGSFTMAVRRERILEDAMNNLVHAPHTELKKPLRVVFVGEDGLDEGGVRKEFFQLVIRELFNPDFSMFIYEEEHGLYYFNPDTLETTVQFLLAGILIGLAIYNGILLPVHFPLAVWKKLLGVPLDLSDLKEADPALGYGLEALLDYEGEDLESVFSLSWVVNRVTAYGETKTVELGPGGQDVAVTQTNKREYVRRYTDWRLVESVRCYFDSFVEGFHRVCGGPVLTLFRPEELQEVVIGSTHLDMRELESVTHYGGGYQADHPAVRAFWRVIHSWPVELQKKLLFFATGTDRVPVGGLRSLRFVLHCSGDDTERLPTASTCFNTLYLPHYASEAKLESKLRAAIEFAEGFGLM